MERATLARHDPRAARGGDGAEPGALAGAAARAAGGDKTHHLIAYAALAGPVALAGPRGWGWVIAGLLGWSGAIELVQPLVNRWRELGDLAANGAGLALGAAAGAALRRLSRRRGRPEAGSG